MRLFVAVDLPSATRDGLYADVAPLRAATDAVKWVAAPLLHLTVKFLGEREPALVEDLEDVLSRVASRHGPMRVATTDVGAFPNFRRPRVVWIGMRGEGPLLALARDVDQALVSLGIEPERRPFQAHLTIGRVKRDLAVAEAVGLTKAAGGARPRREFTIERVDLMRSELGPGGSRYSVVASAPLRARGS